MLEWDSWCNNLARENTHAFRIAKHSFFEQRACSSHVSKLSQFNSSQLVVPEKGGGAMSSVCDDGRLPDEELEDGPPATKENTDNMVRETKFTPNSKVTIRMATGGGFAAVMRQAKRSRHFRATRVADEGRRFPSAVLRTHIRRVPFG
jgi:hypothetical protein